MRKLVLDYQQLGADQLGLAGGKGANAGQLARQAKRAGAAFQMPEGFCVTTAGYEAAIAQHKQMQSLLNKLDSLESLNNLSKLNSSKHNELQQGENGADISREIRSLLLMAELPALTEAVVGQLARLGEQHAYAVRSSSTAEDLPHASFAGQHDTYLNISGAEAIVQHIRKCWASLFTDRAISYRMQHGIAHREVQMAVLVQRMVFPQVSGVMFTADPVTSHRGRVVIDAGYGLGEALVSGQAAADYYCVQEDKITDKRIAIKSRASYGSKDGGTVLSAVAPERQGLQALSAPQILQLARIGRELEAFFGCPQDVEWGLADGVFYIFQSRPITTLYPLPVVQDQAKHVYVSVGHQQMMTDPMKPLGLSLFLHSTYAPMHTAGGRLFVDITPQLLSPAGQKALLSNLGSSDPLIRDALENLIARDAAGSSPSTPARSTPASAVDKQAEGVHAGHNAAEGAHAGHNTAAALKAQNSESGQAAAQPAAAPAFDPTLVPELIRRGHDEIDAVARSIQTKSGMELFDFIMEDVQHLKKMLFDPQSLGVIRAALHASSWLNEHMALWLGEKNAADVLSRSVPYNITSEMGLALLELADVIRPHPDLVALLQQVEGDDFRDELRHFAGGQEVREAVDAFLAKFGMRCPGEIDISRTRWSEKPTALLPVLLGHIQSFEPQAAARKFEQGRQEALAKAEALVKRIVCLPDGERKAEEIRAQIDVLRATIGYREYPKYRMIQRYFIYKQALLKEAEKLVQAGVLQQQEDCFALTFEEFRDAVRLKQADGEVISKRKAEYELFKKMTPPRVMTSEGEIVIGSYKREQLPADALAGLAVSSGIAEGRARVLLDMEDAQLARLEAGDILVTTFTDPSWTPLFVAVKGLVTEVGGLNTHGAVVAREYGLPAVVGVENATRRIKDGQRIRVNGTEGYVELL